MKMLRKFLVVVLMLLVTSEFVLAEKFLLTGKGNASALVKDKKLELKVETGDAGNYLAERMFKLSIGECVITANPSFAKNKVMFDFTLEGKVGSINNPTTFVVKDGMLTVYGDSQSFPISCGFKFKQIGDEYKIDVGLSGDVPPGFKLSSDMAELYIDPNSKAVDKDKMSTTAIVGILTGLVFALIAILVSLVVCGLLILRHRRNRKEQREQDRLKTAVSADDKPESKVEGKSDIKAEERSEAPKKADKIEGKKSEAPKKADKIERKNSEAPKKANKIERKKSEAPKKADKIERKKFEVPKKVNKIERKKSKVPKKDDKTESKESKVPKKDDKTESKESKGLKEPDTIEGKKIEVPKKADKVLTAKSATLDSEDSCNTLAGVKLDTFSREEEPAEFKDTFTLYREKMAQEKGGRKSRGAEAKHQDYSKTQSTQELDSLHSSLS